MKVVFDDNKYLWTVKMFRGKDVQIATAVVETIIVKFLYAFVSSVCFLFEFEFVPVSTPDAIINKYNVEIKYQKRDFLLFRFFIGFVTRDVSRNFFL